MRLVRNTTPDGKCKYALVRMDKIRKLKVNQNLGGVEAALKVLEDAKVLEYAGKGDPEEAFVIKLKDVNASAALDAYADSIYEHDPALAHDVYDLSKRSDNREDSHQPD